MNSDWIGEVKIFWRHRKDAVRPFEGGFRSGHAEDGSVDHGLNFFFNFRWPVLFCISLRTSVVSLPLQPDAMRLR